MNIGGAQQLLDVRVCLCCGRLLKLPDEKSVAHFRDHMAKIEVGSGAFVCVKCVCLDGGGVRCVCVCLGCEVCVFGWWGCEVCVCLGCGGVKCVWLGCRCKGQMYEVCMVVETAGVKMKSSCING